MESSASPIPSPIRVARASVMRRSRSTSASCRSSSMITGGLPLAHPGSLLEPPGPPSAMSGGWSSSAIDACTLLSEDAVRLHDVLHDLVPNDVAGAEVGHLDPLDVPED